MDTGENMETLIHEIQQLKQQKNAVIFAHNYELPEVQDIADVVGDSLQLAQAATKLTADMIVFCGVDFMAESAKILNPEKKVLLPEERADCAMALFATAEKLRDMKKRYPDALVVTYVNSSAAVKAESDICCTSANAVDVVASLPEGRPIIFVPDKNLGHYVAQQTQRKVIFWEGYCCVHDYFLVSDVEKARVAYPGFVLMVHPECPPEVVAAADVVASTGQMLRQAKNYDKMIIGTETGMIHQLKKQYPNKEFVALSEFAICRTMKMTTLAKIHQALVHERYEILLDENVQKGAYAALKRMLDFSAGTKAAAK